MLMGKIDLLDTGFDSTNSVSVVFCWKPCLDNFLPRWANNLLKWKRSVILF